MQNLNIPAEIEQFTFKHLYNQKCKEVEYLLLKIQKLSVKGSACSTSGTNYEKKIHAIVRHCTFNDISFNTQFQTDVGGSTAINDIVCNKTITESFGIEIKKYNTPDWMQCSLTYNCEKNKYEVSDTKKSKIPIQAKELFSDLIKNVDVFNNEDPVFIRNKITYSDWTCMKENTTTWNDMYIDIPDDTILKMYSYKNCKYIQISNGFGLYHLGEDVCEFKVDPFIVKQRMRIRVKVHSRKNKSGLCSLSIMASCQPIDIHLLPKSLFSLESEDRLPISLKYKN